MTDACESLASIAAAVREGRQSARTATLDALTRISALDPKLRAVTRVLRERALRAAEAVDAKVSRGIDPGPLAGVPFGVKDLFAVRGLPNTAGAAARRDAPPEPRDALAIRRLEEAGAILTATLNMDAFAYGFVTDNAFHGITRNPHDIERFAGGSSGGSAAAVAGGLLPLTLGSDTNGSIRVPAALCGVYGLKPTHDGLPMGGVYPFAPSFDDIGPFTARLDDLKLAYEVLRGAPLRTEPEAPLRVGRLDGWFARNLDPALVAGLDRLDLGLGGLPRVELPQAERARSAAYLMTAVEGGAQHLPALRLDPLSYDPAVRDRLIAGALLPASVYREAVAFRAWFLRQVDVLFQRFDVLIAPAVGGVAPRIDHPLIPMDGQMVPARSHLGLYTQPLSFAGLPVIAAPIRGEGLPLGVQLVGRPGGEAQVFALAERMQRAGLIGAPSMADTWPQPALAGRSDA
jgi:AtzE family amidohydrolase